MHFERRFGGAPQEFLPTENCTYTPTSDALYLPISPVWAQGWQRPTTRDQESQTDRAAPIGTAAMTHFNRPAMLHWRASTSKGVWIYGLPGTGKTSTAYTKVRQYTRDDLIIIVIRILIRNRRLWMCLWRKKGRSPLCIYSQKDDHHSEPPSEAWVHCQ